MAHFGRNMLRKFPIYKTNILSCWFQIFSMFWMLLFFLLGDSSALEFYVPTLRNTLSHLHRCCKHLWRWNSVPKRRHIKFRRQGITQKKEYNILSCNRRCLFLYYYYYYYYYCHHNDMNQGKIKGNYSELHKPSDCKVRISEEHDSRRQQSSHLRHNTNGNALSGSSKFHHNTKLPKCPSRSALAWLREYYVLKALGRAYNFTDKCIKQ